MASRYGTVKQVISGDTLVLIGVPRGGPPPEKQVVLSSIVAPRIGMKSKNFETTDEPLAWNAREFLRRLAIGAPVEYSIEYEDKGKEYASVKLNGEDLGLRLVQEGFAKVLFGKSTVNFAKNISDLKAAESKAKDAKLGIWGDNTEKLASSIRHIEWISNDAAATKAFTARQLGKRLPAIVEFIRDGGAYRVYFINEHVNATVLLSGIHVDAFRRLPGTEVAQAEPFAEEAKYFCTTRVLNRELDVRIEGCDDFANIYGTFIHPNGNISILLLRNGFARTNEKTISLTESPTTLREAQKMAQSERVRKWKSYEPIDTDSMKEYTARIMEIVSGDNVIVSEINGNNEELCEEKKLYLASIRCPRAGTKNRPEEPWGMEAKEFTRKKLIGKKVKVIFEYTRSPPPTSTQGIKLSTSTESSGNRHFVSIIYDNGKYNINEDLVAEGLATVNPDRSDDPVASNYDILVVKQAEAIEKKKGLHGRPSDAPKYRVNDISGSQNSGIARSFEESLKRVDTLEGIIDYVISPSRFKLRIPSESLAFVFALSGIRCPSLNQQPSQINGKSSRQQQPDEFAEEALHFSRKNYLQRAVNIKILTCTRAGTFKGIIWFNKDCANVQLIKHGFGEIEGRIPSVIQTEMENAQCQASEKRLGIWSCKSISEEIEPVNDKINQTVPSVFVVHANSITDFYIQISPPTIVDQLQENISIFRKESTSDHYNSKPHFSNTSWPKLNDCVIAEFSEDNQWYRARVEKLNKKDQTVVVCYIDFGNTESLPLNKLHLCPASFSLTKIPSLSTRCMLAGLKPPPEMESEGAEMFFQLTENAVFNCVIEHIDKIAKKSSVQLYPSIQSLPTSHSTNQNGVPIVSPVSLNETLVSTGFAIVDKKTTTDIKKNLMAAETKARKARLNVWRHGDIDDDSESETEFHSAVKLRKRDLEQARVLALTGTHSLVNARVRGQTLPRVSDLEYGVGEEVEEIDEEDADSDESEDEETPTVTKPKTPTLNSVVTPGQAANNVLQQIPQSNQLVPGSHVAVPSMGGGYGGIIPIPYPVPMVTPQGGPSSVYIDNGGKDSGDCGCGCCHCCDSSCCDDGAEVTEEVTEVS